MNGVAQSKILLLLLGFFSASEEEGKDCSLFFLALVQMLAVYHDKRVEEGGVEIEREMRGSSWKMRACDDERNRLRRWEREEQSDFSN